MKTITRHRYVNKKKNINTTKRPKVRTSGVPIIATYIRILNELKTRPAIANIRFNSVNLGLHLGQPRYYNVPNVSFALYSNPGNREYDFFLKWLDLGVLSQNDYFYSNSSPGYGGVTIAELLNFVEFAAANGALETAYPGVVVTESQFVGDGATFRSCTVVSGPYPGTDAVSHLDQGVPTQMYVIEEIAPYQNQSWVINETNFTDATHVYRMKSGVTDKLLLK